MDSTAHRNSSLLLVAFVAALVLSFGGLVAGAVMDAVADVTFDPSAEEVSP